ncbi:uncharacterized protein [Dermacentor albipictus]|uniref:uncharacterized protein isoform X2 n=1 Tax=Dermacentor albipictus TaxID=60249 RepID=UPI0038FD0D7B
MFIAQGNNSAVPSALQKIFGKCRAQLKSVECDVRLKHREDIFDRTLETTLAPWFGVADAAGACCQLSAAGFTGCPHLQGQDESRPSELSERLSFRRAAWNYAEVVGAPHIGSGTVEHSLGPRSVFPHREQKTPMVLLRSHLVHCRDAMPVTLVAVLFTPAQGPWIYLTPAL